MMKFVNCTPHTINLNDGTEYPCSGNIARVSASFTEFDTDGCTTQVFGDIIGLPEPCDGTYYIVSMFVFQATDRTDVVIPATGHPLCKRENGLIVSVPGFVKKA